MSEPIDLDHWTPPGRATAEYAVELLRSTHLPEVQSAEDWLAGHPAQAVPALVAALASPSAQPAAVLLGSVGGDDEIPALLDAHERGGEGLRASVERALALNGSAAALDALKGLRAG